ncbi:MAG: substrate-binding domain-containing protein [Proteobacteria bacterium]|nr:substrate-binding domain-containing protein [Pseudomonadota bacterium]
MTVRTFLVVASLVLSVLIGVVIANGGGGANNGHGAGPSQPTMLIGLAMDTLQEARWQSDRDVFVARAEELGAKVLVQSANSDDVKQMQDVQSLITAGVNVLVLIPHDGTAMAKAVRLAHKAAIPVIAYDRLIRDCELDLYLSFDNVRVGELQAQYLLDTLKPSASNPIRIVRIYGSPADNNSAMFKQGQDNVLEAAIQAGHVSVLFEDWANEWKPTNAKKIVNAALTQHGSDFEAVLASNDGTAGGAIQALLEEGLAGQMLVTGQDADLVAVQRIARGTQSMTIYKPLKTLARGAAEVAVKMATRKPIVARHAVYNGKIDVPAVLFQVVTVRKGNLLDTVIADGFHRYDDVYEGVPEAERPPRPAAKL